MRNLMILLCSLAALGAGVGLTLSAFSDEATNSGNSFDAAAVFPSSSLRMASGSYTGNAVNNRSINAGFQPDVVIVKANATRAGVMRTSTMTGDSAKPLSGATALTANTIQSLASNGFTVGTSALVNASGTSYYWQAFKADPGVLKVGSYTGNGATSRALAGFDFGPEYAAVLPASTPVANHRFAGMTRGFQFDADTGTATRITSLNADGFTVGSSGDVNTSGATYHYVAFNELAGSIKQSTYTGTGATRNVTGVGFQPDYVMTRANDTATARQGNHRSASVPGSESLFYGAASNTTTGITSLLGDGFQVGTNAAANANGLTYHYLAFKNTGGG